MPLRDESRAPAPAESMTGHPDAGLRERMRGLLLRRRAALLAAAGSAWPPVDALAELARVDRALWRLDGDGAGARA